MDDVLLQSLKAEIGRLRARMSGLEMEMEQLRRVREAQLQTFLQVQWCITCEPEDEEAEYPTSGTVFPIKFLDAHFVGTAGNQAFAKTERSEKAVTLAFCSHYMPVNTPCPVFWKRGLGDPDADETGEWWLLDLSLGWHRGITTARLDKGGHANVTRYTPGTTTPVSGDPDVVYNELATVGPEKVVYYMPAGDKLFVFAAECPLQ